MLLLHDITLDFTRLGPLLRQNRAAKRRGKRCKPHENKSEIRFLIGTASVRPTADRGSRHGKTARRQVGICMAIFDDASDAMILSARNCIGIFEKPARKQVGISIRPCDLSLHEAKSEFFAAHRPGQVGQNRNKAHMKSSSPLQEKRYFRCELTQGRGGCGAQACGKWAVLR